MLKKIVSFLLAFAVLSLSALTTIPQTKDLEKTGFSAENRLRPSLKDFFAAEKNKVNADRPFTEEDVKKLEKESLNAQVKRSNLSSTAKIGIGAAIAAGVILVILLATRGGDDDESPCRPVGIMAPCPPGCVCTQ